MFEAIYALQCSKSQRCTMDLRDIYVTKLPFPRLFKEMAVAMLGHPACALQVADMNSLSAFGVLVGIQAEDDLRSLAPVCTFCIGIK